jgi:hypothetical protein
MEGITGENPLRSSMTDEFTEGLELDMNGAL